LILLSWRSGAKLLDTPTDHPIDGRLLRFSRIPFHPGFLQEPFIALFGGFQLSTL
jgi:hypothetical protein